MVFTKIDYIGHIYYLIEDNDVGEKRNTFKTVPIGISLVITSIILQHHSDMILVP